METLKQLISDAESRKIALGHFNVSDTETLWGIFNAARSLNVPVIIGTSEGERDFIGTRQAVALVKSLREEYNYPIFLNADHTYSLEKVKEAVHAGYDAIIFDGVKLSAEENIKITKQCVEYAKSVNPHILVEGEIGFIGTSSKLLDEIPVDADVTEEHITKPEDIAKYVRETGVDLIAPAVGNLHGMLKHSKNPKIYTSRITELRKAGGVPIVLHGGSGISDEDFISSIKAGVSIVHINTEIRVAYKKAIALSLQENPEEVAPYKFMKSAVQEVQKVVKKRLKLFNLM
jgi:fructose-bisphosphate aldolase, class II